MALSAKLQLRQSQALVMTPQLMQAIKLLQFSHLDLASYVETELERNPLLERGEEDGPTAVRDDGERRSTRDDATSDLVATAGDGDVARLSGDLDADFSNVFDAETAQPQNSGGGAAAPQDSGWGSVRGDRRGGEGEGSVLEATLASAETLHDHLLRQLGVASADPRVLMIGANLIGVVDEAGYLGEAVEDVAARLGTSAADVEAVLGVIQRFDPPGVAARNLAECLAIQLAEKDRYDPAMQCLVANLDVLARRDLAQLRRICGVDAEDLADMIAELRRLDPKPGHAFGGDPVQPVVPDVFVRARPDGGWHVELNSETMPRVLVDQTYYATVARTARSEGDRSYLSDCLQQANWLVRSLDQRARTILKVAGEIVRQQDAFLSQGVQYLRPLNLKTIAAAIDMHESTVSRVTANKYLATPRGIFEMKYFFTTAIAATAGGEAHSAEAVRHRIREMIDAEAPDAILSDDALVKALRDEGVDIARRTVAKYRESLRIASSVQRRRDKRAAG